MVNSPLIRPYFLGGVALGGVARIPMIEYPSPFEIRRPPDSQQKVDAKFGEHQKKLQVVDAKTWFVRSLPKVFLLYKLYNIYIHIYIYYT